MKLTCICPCWKRPQRTLRAIESVLKQNFQGAETIFIGDKCPEFQKFLDDGTFAKYQQQAGDNELIFKNSEIHGGGWGHHARKEAIDMARGEYICFLDNDDMLLPNHFTNYYTFMKNHPEVDMGYFNAYTKPWNKKRNAVLSRGGIGNAELIFRADVLKKEYELDEKYEHDWRLVDRIIKKKYSIRKCNNEPTYIIMSIPNFRETNID
jgi:hypothetical protein